MADDLLVTSGELAQNTIVTNSRRIFWVTVIILIMVPLLVVSMLVFIGPLPGQVGFGYTPAQCQSALRAPWVVTADKKLVSPHSRVYHTGGWAVTVGFDERDLAGQFVYAREYLPLLGSAALDVDDQFFLLSKFKEGSRWVPEAPTDTGPQWTRADQQAYAGYVVASRWFILMNNSAMTRQIKALPEN